MPEIVQEPETERKFLNSENLSLSEFNDEIKTCMNCPLGATRNQFVFGVGNPDADLMFVGEAPGEREDAEGIPFVGRAGKLLDDILKAIDLNREDVYIANVLKCRPPENRDPKREEIEECEPYLLKQIELIKPKLLVALGRISATTLLRSKESLTAMRGKVFDYHGTDLVVTYHPAALLRNPNWKRPAWEDFKKIQEMYLQKRGEQS
ncbi:MAG: uracil-DNA glycosylase [Candidatus Marinimicrobia bacterium]|nr:uracil-DNA glycosylase [Candidatus Neomarinimicrobiota bacterium]